MLAPFMFYDYAPKSLFIVYMRTFHASLACLPFFFFFFFFCCRVRHKRAFWTLNCYARLLVACWCFFLSVCVWRTRTQRNRNNVWSVRRSTIVAFVVCSTQKKNKINQNRKFNMIVLMIFPQRSQRSITNPTRMFRCTQTNEWIQSWLVVHIWWIVKAMGMRNGWWKLLMDCLYLPFICICVWLFRNKEIPAEIAIND